MNRYELISYIRDCIKESEKSEKDAVFIANKNYCKGKIDSYKDILRLLT